MADTARNTVQSVAKAPVLHAARCGQHGGHRRADDRGLMTTLRLVIAGQGIADEQSLVEASEYAEFLAAPASNEAFPCA